MAIWTGKCRFGSWNYMKQIFFIFYKICGKIKRKRKKYIEVLVDVYKRQAVNSAVQGAIGAISGGVATAQGGVANLQAHAGQVSGLNDAAAQIQSAAGEVSNQNVQAAAAGDAAAQLQEGLAQIESGLAALNNQSAEDAKKDAQTQACLLYTSKKNLQTNFFRNRLIN